jgi:transposase
MKLHRSAALSWSGRRRLARSVVVEGSTIAAAAEAAGVRVRCARKWVSRYRSEGERGLHDRSSAPRRVATRTPAERVEVVVGLRRLRFTAAEIAETLGMALSTVSAILVPVGMGRLGRLGLEQPVRYERSRPGELVHIDVKMLGRIQGGAGWRVRGGRRHHNYVRTDRDGHGRKTVGYEYVHIVVDDYSRLAYAEVLPDEKAATAIGFLRRALAYYRRYGIRVERILTDDGVCYRGRASTRSPAARSESATAVRAPTGRRQTGRRSASSARRSQAGPTARSTARVPNAQRRLTDGCGTTTIDGDTQPSAANPR